MQKTALVHKKLDLSFYHKNSEVSFDPTNKFYQASFNYDLEKEVYEFIDSFVGLMISDDKKKDFGALPRDKNMSNFYFSLVTEFGNVTWEKYNAWYFDRKAKLQLRFREIIVNAIDQEKSLNINGLEYLAWLSSVTLVSVMIDEYFTTHFEKLNIMRETLTYLLGELFEIIFSELYNDAEIGTIRAERTAADTVKIEPLINRYIMMFNDVAYLSHVEKMLYTKDSRILIDRHVLNKMLHVFEEVISASKRLERRDSVRCIISDMGLVRVILGGKAERRRFSSLIKKDPDLKEKMAVKKELASLLAGIRSVLAETGSGPLMNFVTHPENIEEMLKGDREVSRYMQKALAAINTKKAAELAALAEAGADRVRRSRKTFWGRLSGKELDAIVGFNLENTALYLKTALRFHTVRGIYGKKSSYSDELHGLKILRQSRIAAVKFEEIQQETIECLPVTDDKKTRIENLFEEGSLFYIREEGPLYPGSGERPRGKKLFMFADLRNSTETTMKLTKDTAAYLTPYLNTVYSVSKKNSGSEIYFAGDGYAAHFTKVSDALRSSYMIHAEFAKLRKESEDKSRQKEKSLLKDLVRIGAIREDGKGFKEVKVGAEESEELKELMSVAAATGGARIEDTIRMAAEEYSMPKVEIGIGITEGELFFAVIGEGDVRFNIVLSPSLTQAARLSGSHGEVKAYLEKLHGLKKIPRRVYAYQKKHFNQGIAVTREVFNTLRQEVEVELIGKDEIGLSYDVYYYYDGQLGRNVVISKLEEGVLLKGIDSEIEIFEVFTPVTGVDEFVNAWIAKNVKKS